MIQMKKDTNVVEKGEKCDSQMGKMRMCLNSDEPMRIIADILTKLLALPAFETHRTKLGLDSKE
jgi:hypothetical protein